MFISQINIQNFRNFKGDNNVVEFNEGINIIIGHNNSGKSNLLKALDLVLNVGSSKKLSVDDFNKEVSIAELREKPPKVSITVTFSESANEPEFSEDLVTVSTWLTELKSPYKAQLTYVFYLPEKEEAEYKREMSLLSSSNINEYWLTIKHNFLRKYKSAIYGGNPDYKNSVDTEALKKIDFQFLDAIRDVERDLFTGRNTLLREVIDFFMDYEIKSNKEIDKSQQLSEINQLKKEFSQEAAKLINSLKRRMERGTKEMLTYANHTGASFGNSEPDFDGYILDSELYSVLRLIIKYQTGITVPATHNGLGYNNLIFISLLLAKMQKDASGDYLGSNAKIFPILVIEEPEAHLHPAMQYKFLKFLKEKSHQKARQIFITTHSPNITSAVDLDEIICFHRKDDNSLNIGYLGRAFGDDKKSKAYVQRFLDSTKSDMLFSKGIILVEGITEQLVMSLFARYEDFDLETNHISVINIGGRYFEHFLKLFDSNKSHTIHKKVVCITDLDPVRKIKQEEADYERCYPFELDIDKENYLYRNYSNDLIDKYSIDRYGMSTHPNIVCFSQEKGIGKTFEYTLAYTNPNCKLIITDSISNSKELNRLFDAYSEGKELEELINIHGKRGEENTRVIESIRKYKKPDVKEHLIASRYLNSIKKGENAFELAQALEENLETGNVADFKVPNYIREAITWICR
ncbi:chromosome segregation protein SMC [Aneurinibacillus migulanus]|uniref:ATP-dependent nuclease n=1 Tax=Aneurinibacillus migulanus TaxID=47500 RepID=UPI0005BD7155|nr:AAA family ATPase [Aneurinibacillus migulanus]KIV58373.1 chromosome segregation protein SMC [Aneurinibacillus migulanus]KPD05682.1 chromosome segregation protein SMC [Aneurinibacillus migulanus]